MTPATKSAWMWVGMLLVGALLGAGGTLWVQRGRPGPMPPGDHPGGFVEHMEEVIQPTDSAQRSVILPILEETDRQNRQAVDVSRATMRASLDSMQVKLLPLLDQAQRDRLSELIRRVDAPPQGPPDQAAPGPMDRPPPPPR